MTIAGCKVIFNLQKQILNAPELSSDRKVEMLKECINDTLGGKPKGRIKLNRLTHGL